MKTKDNQLAGDIIDLLDARHMGDIKTARGIIAKLKNKLGTGFHKTLLRHGDPDINYAVVRNAWCAELQE